MAMIIHNPSYWVGGVIRKKEWLLTAPVSEELIYLSIDQTTFHSIREHRMRLLKCVEVYDHWWAKVSS